MSMRRAVGGRSPFIALRAVLFSSSMVALVPLPVHAQCKQWDVSGKWTLEQSDGYTVTVDLKQNGNSITGRA